MPQKKLRKSGRGPARPSDVDLLRRFGSPWIMLALILAVGLAYGNSLGGEFIFDDGQLTRNTQLQAVDSFSDALAFGGFRGLTFITYALNVNWGGMNPFGFHVVNVLIHAINVLLAYLLLLHLSANRRFPAAVGALIFAVHPLFTEAVSYISGRPSLLCGTFYFLSVFAFLRGLDSPVLRSRVLWFLSAALAGVLAWNSKEEALALPVTLFALAWIRKETNWKLLVPIVAALVAILVYYRDTLVRLFSTVQVNAALTNAGAEPVLQAPEFFRTYVTAIVGYYFPRFVIPVGLSGDPFVPAVDGWFSPEFLFSVAVLGAIGFVIFRGSRHDRWLVTGLAVLVVSPLTAYAFVPLADVVLEHRVYIPGIGVAVLWGWIANAAMVRYRHRSLVLLAAAVMFAVMTVGRNRVWADNITFWETTEAASPEHVRPHLNLGQQYQLAGRIDEAIREYQHALEINPRLAAAKSNLAGILINLGRADEAEVLLRQVTVEAPLFAEGWVNLSAVFLGRGELEEALRVLDRGLEVDPNSPSIFINRGDVYTEMGEYGLALASYRRAIELRPDVLEFQLNLSMGYYRAGDRTAAENELLSLADTPLGAAAFQNLGILATDAEDFSAALRYFTESARLNPDPAVINAIGSTHMVMENWAAAVGQFERVLRVQPGYPPAVLNIAAAYDALGDGAASRRTLEQFLVDFPNSPYRDQVRQRLTALAGSQGEPE